MKGKAEMVKKAATKRLFGTVERVGLK